MGEFIKVRNYGTSTEMWLNVNTIERVEVNKSTGDYYAVVFNKWSKVYTTYKIISDNDALKLVGEYSVC